MLRANGCAEPRPAKTTATPTATAGQGHRTPILRLDSSFKAMKLEPTESVTEHSLHSLFHQTSARVLRETIDQVEARVGKLPGGHAATPAPRGSAIPAGNSRSIPRSAWQGVR